jgi:predicted  nucleic acid-binding Zn-ribbon protein
MNFVEIISVVLVILSYAVTFGMFIQRVKSLKVESDERFQFLMKELDTLKSFKETNKDTLNEINVSLRILTNEISYIKKHIEKLERVIDENK